MSERLTIVPTVEHRYTLVFLHGFQMQALDLLEDFTCIQEQCPHWRIVLPQAPVLAITAHEGNSTPSWYDYLTDTDGASEDYIDFASLRVRRVELEALLRAEAELLKNAQKQADYSRLFVGGLSQGGTMALDLATHIALGGVVTLAAPRLSASLRRPLLCTWNGLFATNDTIFPSSWAAPLYTEATATWCDAEHDLEGVDTVTYVATTLQKFQTPRKDK